MTGRESTKQSTFNPPNEQPKLTKEILLSSLAKIANEVRRLRKATLSEELDKLQRLVKQALENNDEEMKDLRNKIKNLEKELEKEKEEKKKFQHEWQKQKDEDEKLKKKFALAQATWEWEKHLARFVVHSSKKIYQSHWHDQMTNFLTTAPEHNRYTKIQDKLKKTWKDEDWEVVKKMRSERNAIAHPHLIDLDCVESQIEDMPGEHQPILMDMVEQLKMAASLMKFGRLVSYMFQHEGRPKEWKKRTMEIIISWDCPFEDIGGLQNVEHEEAKEYLTKYVDNPKHIDKYISIVDSIKHANGKRLGKLAWEIEASRILTKLSETHGKALNELKTLLPNSKDKIKALNETEAKLHVPDFLLKKFWKHGIEIVEEYFYMHASLAKFGRLAKFYDTNKHLFPALEASGERLDARVLKKIISWDDDEINGLQSIEHGKAKEYMAMYANNRDAINCYDFIVDSIKDGNEKRLGKLAWEIEGSGILTKLSKTHGKALNELKTLLPNPKDKIIPLNETEAKLHVPDFLPDYWWKHGLEIVERYFGKPHHSGVI